MKRLVLLVLGAAIVGALGLYLRRRGETASPQAGPGGEATLPIDPNQPDVAPGPEAREQESAVTEDTRFDRLAEEERQRRREAATRVQDHPLRGQAEVESEEG